MPSPDPESQVRSWGFSHVFTWTDGPNARTRTLLPNLPRTTTYTCKDYPPHSHAALTTHLILSGQLTIAYPRDKDSTKTTFSAGDRIDVDAGRVHEVWIGPGGCTYVIGE